LKKFIDFYEIQQGSHASEDNLDYRSFNHYKMANIQTSEMDAKLEPVNMGP
jgi:hypothetical protein